MTVEIAVLGLDLGKNSCSMAGLDAAGRVVLRRRMHRDGIIRLAAKLPACVVAMEACCGAHHLGRVLQGQGHEVRLMSPEYVRPYVKAQKNDERDAEAIAEAATRPTMRFVELKSEAQLDLQTQHRARDRLVGERTALINQLRGVLAERGILVPQGRRKLDLHLQALMAECEVPLSPRIQALVEDMRVEWRELDRRIEAFDDEFAARARMDGPARLLVTIPGIGVLNATALTAAIGDGQTFRRGRDLAARDGLLAVVLAGMDRSLPSMAGAGAQADDDGRQATAVGDQQAGQRLPAQVDHPRSPCRPADALEGRDAAGQLAARPTGSSPCEQGRGGACRQAGPDRLGSAP